jgi:hypothetical protein
MLSMTQGCRLVQLSSAAAAAGGSMTSTAQQGQQGLAVEQDTGPALVMMQEDAGGAVVSIPHGG